MQNKFTKIILAILIYLFVMPAFALAHQPRINKQTETTVTEPEISKAYYGQLTGIPHYYNIKTETPFDLYVNILVPDIEGQKSDVSAAIVKNRNTEIPMAVLDGINFKWEKFWEPFGHDWYLKGPEYKSQAEAGEYIIVVWSSNNDSKYSLAIGEIENFNLSESANALHLVPKIKKTFFNKPSFDFIFSPLGYGYILFMYAIALIAILACKLILKRFTKNINSRDRWIRISVGIALLLFAIFTTWNPIVLFFSGFCIFEAIFNWCGLYAILGKNTHLT